MAFLQRRRVGMARQTFPGRRARRGLAVTSASMAECGTRREGEQGPQMDNGWAGRERSTPHTGPGGPERGEW